MLIYWLMFAYPAALAMFEKPGDTRQGRFAIAWAVAMVGMVALIGLRWDTGGDWGSYDRMVQSALWGAEPLTPLGDPAFVLLTRIAAQSPYGMLVVTMVSALFMAAGLTRFCLDQQRPWLCLTVAVPYLVVVLGMGYIRQGMAISLLMIALAGIGRHTAVRYVVLVGAAALIHSTALLLLPLAVVITRSSLVARGVTLLLMAALFAYAAVSTRAELLVTNYVEAGAASSGALVRLMMTALPSAMLLVWRRRFAFDAIERRVMLLLSISGITALALVTVFPSSTAIDRVALYLLPLQCLVYARLPEALGGNPRTSRIIVAGIVALYAAAFFIWLNYAVNVEYWLPYRFFPLEDGACLEC